MFISRKKFVKELESAHLRGFIEGLDKGYMRGRERFILEERIINQEHVGKKADTLIVDKSKVEPEPKKEEKKSRYTGFEEEEYYTGSIRGDFYGEEYYR